MELHRKSKLNLLLEELLPEVLLQMKCNINLLLFWILKEFLPKRLNMSSNSILFIHSEKMGDLILCLDFFYSFQNNNDYNRRFILVTEEYLPLLQLFNLDYEILTYNKKKYKYNCVYRFHTLKKLIAKELNTVVNITPERGSLNDEMTILSSAHKMVGLKSNSPFLTISTNNIYKRFYSHFINSNSKNIYTILCDLNRYFGLDTKIFNFLPQSNAENKFDGLKGYILIAPSSSEEFRNWDKYKFRELTKRFSLETKVVIVGTKRQEEVVDFIIDGSTNVNKYIDMNYAELIKLMHNCKLFIGLDSGLSHLALQLDKPTIAIIGGGKHGTFFPYKQNSKNKFLFSQMDCFGCSWVCKYKSPYCISNITIEEVYNTSLQLLQV